MAPGPETKFKNRLLKRLREIHNTWWLKVHGGPMQQRGIPDIIGCAAGHFVAIELKAGKKEPTPLQKRTLHDIRDAYGFTFVISCGAKGERSVNETELIGVIEILAGKPKEDK